MEGNSVRQEFARTIFQPPQTIVIARDNSVNQHSLAPFSQQGQSHGPTKDYFQEQGFARASFSSAKNKVRENQGRIGGKRNHARHIPIAKDNAKENERQLRGRKFARAPHPKRQGQGQGQRGATRGGGNSRARHAQTAKDEVMDNDGQLSFSTPGGSHYQRLPIRKEVRDEK